MAWVPSLADSLTIQRKFLPSLDLLEVQGKKASVLLGLSGDGKSTTLSLLQGANFGRNRRGKLTGVTNQGELKAKGMRIPKIGETATSETLNGGLYRTPDGLWLLDRADVRDDVRDDPIEGHNG